MPKPAKKPAQKPAPTDHAGPPVFQGAIPDWYLSHLRCLELAGEREEARRRVREVEAQVAAGDAPPDKRREMEAIIHELKVSLGMITSQEDDEDAT